MPRPFFSAAAPECGLPEDVAACTIHTTSASSKFIAVVGPSDNVQ